MWKSSRPLPDVDPANRLVAGELERRWNEALQAIAKIEGDIAAMIARRPIPLGEPVALMRETRSTDAGSPD
jgi:hypothetical protein